MLTKEALNTEISPLSAQDTAARAIEAMERAEVKILPVVDSTTKKLIGQIPFERLKEAGSDDRIADLELDEPVKIYLNQHIFEAARLMLQYEIRLLPVVDEEWTYQGALCKSEVLEALTGMLNLAEFGSVITVKLDRRDFTLSEIVHLIETEGAKILGITVEMPEQDKEVFEISIKLNLKDVSRVASALRRYDYDVLTESGNEVFGMDIETRADELIKYLDM